MGQIGCPCGAQISDTTDCNPVKARFIRDVEVEEMEERLIERWAGYLEAAVAGTTEQWLKDTGYSADYLALGLSHEEVLSDLMTVTSAYRFDLFECGACGRLLVETGPNLFDSYVPDAGKPLGPFRENDARLVSNAPPPAHPPTT